MNNLAENLYPMTDTDVEVLYECLGLSVEELEEMKLDSDEQKEKQRNAPVGQLPSVDQQSKNLYTS